ncbi:MAG TPA: DUF4974 domain-containing protein, partial [Paludibacter sp.]|nr:DUF4974 domain-containing protein [Paludibacter sp.]
DVKVLGTVFNVTSYEEDASVAVNLIQGSVNVTLQKSQNPNAVILKPNERLVYNKQSQQLSTSAGDASKSGLWKAGKLYFENETLGDIANKLERKYNVKIFIDNPKIKKETFSGNIDLNNSLKEVFSFIDVDKKFIYKQEGDTFRIN